MPNKDLKVIEDPTPRSFKKQVLYSAVVVFIVGLLVLIFASALTGGIIALIGLITGIGSRIMDI